MTAYKPLKPAFQSVELDPIDLRLEAKAVEKGIPTLVTQKLEATEPAPDMKPLNTEVPGYTWTSLKIRAAQEMTSVRYIVLSALRDAGIDVRDADLVEDGRRLRGGEQLS